MSSRGERLRLSTREAADVVGEPQGPRDLTLRVVIAVQQEDRNPLPMQPAHLLGEEEPRPVVLPGAVVQIASDDEEVHLFADGFGNQVLESVAGGRANPVGNPGFVTLESPQGAVEVDIGGVEKAEPAHRHPVCSGAVAPGRRERDARLPPAQNRRGPIPHRAIAMPCPPRVRATRGDRFPVQIAATRQLPVREPGSPVPKRIHGPLRSPASFH